ncbi:hypothetical protein DY000_02014351 [Brassica cretica]|uniref:Exocyst subunit Exo70 family protein n=1 Tax=Brassica cretica TaxID=69181 RepID=A0ABQ7CW20_BRACR|nr:hypothetical protein DY000_02014351 [Brassica cretica]
MRPGSGQDIFHCLALILGKLLIEVPVGEQASLESRDGSGDAASGNGHLLLIEAGYVASQRFLPMLEDFVEAIIGLLQVLAMDLEGRLIYHCRAGLVRVEPNPFHIVASRGPFGSATASILCLYWATWSSGSVAPSYAFMLGKENFLRILIKVHSRVLEKTSDGLYEIVQHRAEPLKGYLARFNQEKVAIFKCSIPTAISAFKRGLLPDGDLYKELTKYQCKTMEDVLSQAWAQVNWEEDVASRAKAQQKQDTKTTRSDRTDQDEKPSQRPARDSGNRNRSRYKNRHIEKAVSTWPDISHLSVSSPELINVLREFLSEKAKSHLSKETMGKPAEAAPVSSPRQDRVIHVISGSSEINGISHAAAKKSTWS